MVRELSGKPLTSGGMSNPLLSAERYGVQIVVKAVDEKKNEQSAAICSAIRCENRRESG